VSFRQLLDEHCFHRKTENWRRTSGSCVLLTGRLQTRSNSAQLTLVGFSPAVRRFDELPGGKSPLPKEPDAWFENPDKS
jgi:hypothetical protein